MRYKVVNKVILVSVVLLSSAHAFAKITIDMFGKNQCSEIAGLWNGTGHVSALDGVVKCDYQGSGIIDGSNEFYANLNLNRTGGSSLCPDSKDIQFTGACDNETGEIIINTDEANLTGSIDKSAHIVYLNGNLNMNGIKAKLDAVLNKQS